MFNITTGSEDIYSGELKLILALIWTLFQHYKIRNTLKSTKEAMISFFARVCNVEVSNVTTDWNDGIVLSRVIEYLHPGLFPDITSLSSANKKDNCNRAITSAKEKLNIPPIISADDMADPDVEEKPMMMYLSYYIKPCIKKIHEWAQSLVPDRAIRNMSSDWCSGVHLTALINAIRPDILPKWTVLNEECGIKNITKALGVAKDFLGIEPSLKPDDMAKSTIDEMSVSEYLAPFMSVKRETQSVDYSTITATGGGLKGGYAGRAESVTVKATESGLLKEDDLTAVMKSTVDDTQQALVEMKDQGNGVYLLTYEAATAGDYILNIDYKDNPIARSPFTVTILEPPNASKCQLQVTETVIIVKKAVTFTIDCTSAGHGELAVTVNDPTGNEIEHSISELNKVYTITFTPTFVGDYIIEALWSGKTISTVPLVISTFDPSLVRFIPAPTEGLIALTGDTIGFDIDTTKAGKGSPVAQAIINDEAPQDIKLTGEGKENYILKYNFERVGKLQIIVKFNSITILEHEVTVKPHPDASKCIATVLSTADEYLLNVSQTIAISVDCTNAGTGELSAKSTAQRRDQHTDIIKKSDFVYDVQLVPEQAGVHSIAIFWAGKPIPGNPFNFDIVDTSKLKFLKLPKQDEYHPLTGETFTFDIDVSKAGKGKLVAEIVSAGNTETLSLTEKGSRVYGIQYTLLHIGHTEVYVRYNGEQLLSYMITVRAAPDSSRCKLDLSALERESLFNIGESIEFIVDCTEAGVGDLTSKAVGPCKEVEVNTITERDSVYRLQIKPVNVGVHSLTVMWAGQSITTTPVTFEVVDPNRVKFNNLPNAEEYVPCVGEDLLFTVDTKNAGSAKLESQIILPDGSSQVVHIKEKMKGVHIISYKFTEVSSLEFLVLFNQVKVLSFPCAVNNAPECTVTLPTLEQGTFLDVGQMIDITVDCTDAGYGELTIKAFGPQSREIEVQCSLENYDSRKVYKISHEPSCAGGYDIAVMWAGKAIPKSPFKFEVVDSRQVQFSNLPSTEDYAPITGDVISFDVDISNAGKGELRACAIQEDASTQDIVVSNKGVGLYAIKHTMLHAGRFELCVIFNSNKLLTRTIKVREAPVASHCRSVLQEVQSYAVGQSIEFKVDCIDAGGGVLSAVAKDQSGKEVLVYISEHIQVYTVRFETTTVGKYTVEVFWSGKPIPNSPFTFETTDLSKVAISSNLTKTKDFKPIVGKDISYDINVGQAGKGVLIAQVLFSEGGAASMRITEKDHGMYNCSYQPTRSGSIEIVITYGGIRVFNQSVVIYEAPDAAKCKVLLGTAEQEACYITGQTISFKINCACAGAGELTAVATGPQRKQIQAKVTAIDNDQYEVSFESRWIGTYSIQVFWGGNLIPGAPFNFEVNDPKRVKFIELPKSYSLQAVVGREIKFDVDVSTAGKGALIANVEYEHGYSEEGQVVPKSDGIFSILCLPKTAGSITITVLFSGANILSYPLTIKAAPNSSKCRVTFDSSKSQDDVYITGESIQFVIDCSEAGTGDLLVCAQDPNGKSYKVTLQEEQKLTYKIKFEVSLAGQYKFEALWAGEPIPGCPFTVEVVDPGRLKFVNLPSAPEFVGVVGKVINFNVDVSEAGRGVLLVQAYYSDGTVSEFNKTEISDGLFAVSHIPVYTGIMDIVVYYSGNISITRSIMINKGAEASMCRVNLTALRSVPSLFVHRVAEFSIDCTEAGTGNLSVTISNPCNKPINADIKDTKGIFAVKFQPDEVGTYKIAIFWSDAPVPGSPFTVSAIDPKKIKFQNLPGTQGHLMSATVNQPISFTVDTSQAGAGSFNAQAVVEDGNIESFLMTSIQSGVYDLSYTPHTAGNLRFGFWYNDVKFHSMNWICQMASKAKLAPAFSIHRTIEEEELQLTEVDALWIKIQMTTFKNWVNDVLRGNLKRAKGQVEILQWDFRDGLLLIALLECLVKHSKISHCNPEPVNKMQKLENLAACFDLMEGENIKLVNIGEYVSSL